MRAALLAWLGLVLAATAGAQPPPDTRAAERIVRRSLEDARALVREGRLEHAEGALRRGLEADPDHARLHRALAEVLAAQGRADAAAVERRLADALDPPPGPLPDGPQGIATAGLLVVLLPPDRDAAHPERLAGGWPEERELRALTTRLRVRLRGARIARADPASLDEARRWLAERAPHRILSLRLERAWCGDSVKDGRFAIASLRAAAAAAGAARAAEALGREVIFDPGPACEADAIARALERALAAPGVADALRAPDGGPDPLPRAALRALFPGIGHRIEALLRDGERLLGEGRISDAAGRFERALALDPQDPIARAYLAETRATIALASELARRAGEPDAPVRLDPRMTPEQVAAAEARLRDERRRRRELLAALAVLEEEARPPDATLLAALPPIEIPGPGARGPALARERAGGEIEARAAFAPDGGLLARYYFPAGGADPVLREDDRDRDGLPDRWVAYAAGARSEVFEAADADRPALRLVFDESGRRLARAEVDADADGRPERILRYGGERPTGEARDSDGDGRLDTFERLDETGGVALREEDLDGDGSIDVRSLYDDGRLVRRELFDAPVPPTDR